MKEAERNFKAGARGAWVAMLSLCLERLGYAGAAHRWAWVEEREAAVAALRTLCAEHGDNDWPDDLHLADVIEKHLGRYIVASDHGEGR